MVEGTSVSVGVAVGSLVDPTQSSCFGLFLLLLLRVFACFEEFFDPLVEYEAFFDAFEDFEVEYDSFEDQE